MPTETTSSLSLQNERNNTKMPKKGTTTTLPKGLDESIVKKMIATFFADNPQTLVRHHIDSFNDFYHDGLPKMFKEMNPLKIELNYDEQREINRSKCHFYFGGKDASRIYYGKPTIHENDKTRFLFPNECRLRNMTYGMTVHYDIDIEIETILEEGEEPLLVNEQNEIQFDDLDSDDDDDDESNNVSSATETKEADEETRKQRKRERKEQRRKQLHTPEQYAKVKAQMENNMLQGKDTVTIEKMELKDIFLGRFPIMVQSDFCILRGMSSDMRHKLGECKHDYGGYFIIDGKEKTIVCQEKFGDNMLRIGKSSEDHVSTVANFKSVSENASKYIRSLAMKVMQPNKNIVVIIPNIRKPVPLFALFRALGILTDKAIIEYCTLQPVETLSASVAEYFNASIHESQHVNTQMEALKYISLLVKQRAPSRQAFNEEHIAKVMHILADYFLPHVGEMNYIEKAYHLGNMTNRLIMVDLQIESPTDRDHYKFKRVEVVGTMMRDLVKEYYKRQQQQIRRQFEIRYEYHKAEYKHPAVMFRKEYVSFFRERMVETGVMKGFKGSWGMGTGAEKVGVTQDLNRLSYNGMISHLRKTSVPIENEKLVEPHMLHGSQWGFIDPMDTPDGGNIGIHKYLSIMSMVSRRVSREPLKEWIEKHSTVTQLSRCNPILVGSKTKIFINGLWVGITDNQRLLVSELKLHRRHALIPITTSITFHYSKNLIEVFTDGGRLLRPILYHDDLLSGFAFDVTSGKDWSSIASLIEEYDTNKRIEQTPASELLWNKLITGFHPKKNADTFDPFHGRTYEWSELYSVPVSQSRTNKSLLEYIDANETETALIAMNSNVRIREPKEYTHMEIHESTILGVMSNMIIYPQHNPLSRNCFSCGQSKQAVSVYHTNYQMRMDKTAVVLNSGQIPLVKSEYLQYINQEEMPYGENAMVAIMCYTGYNVEDAVLINEAALKRGLFRTTYYTTYETHEEREVKNGELSTEKLFMNIANTENVIGTTVGYDYNKLDEHGLIPENTPVDERTILIGASSFVPGKDTRKDVSKKPKKGQLGVVDKSFITEDEEGKRIAKVRVREVRIPTFGDKFSSRAGQKGTIGMVIPEENMPFNKNGIRPDIIINPHALPSRMTIGQLIESVVGKACAMHGAFGDCTAFRDTSTSVSLFGELLSHYKFHSTGNEIMYNGMTGEQIETETYFGPTYYMRLKHMVKDKINSRPRGPNTNLTRQPVSGRANDGGLRIGEMERDAVVSHGMSAFLQESMLDRADDYEMAICNKTGTIAIYNPSKNLMLSPSADGPLQYTRNISNNDEIVKQVSRYGRSFSIVRVPYSLKLLMQELMGINVRLSIVTEDNVSQMDNMNFSKNIDLLLGKKRATPAMIIEQIQETLRGEKKPEELSQHTPTASKSRSTSTSKDTSSMDSEEMDDELKEEDYVQEYPNSPEMATGSVYSPQPGDNMNNSQDSDMSNPFVVGNSSESMSTDFIAGQLVHMRGDTVQDREWTILERRGDQYVIETDDRTEQGLAPGQEIRTVNINEIYLPNKSFMYTYTANQAMMSPYDGNVEPYPMTPPVQMQSPSYYGSALSSVGVPPPPVVVSPQIRIVNGNDNSQNESSSMPGVSPTPLPMSSVPGAAYPQGDIVVRSPPSAAPMGNSVSSSTEMDASAPMDFNNIVIKKA
jgi:DNA-directed RNA polymerase II subunit RPB2